MFGGRGLQRENIFVPEKGFMLEHLDKMGASPLLTSDEMDYYVAEYSRNGLGPACTFIRFGASVLYRHRYLNDIS